MTPGDYDRLILLLTIEIGVIIAVSRLLGVAFRRLQQPQVVGEVIAGILLGPSFLGWLAPDTAAALFPADVIPSLKVLSEYGIILFMFLVGLELDPALLRDRGRAAFGISLASIAVPFALGIGVAMAVHGRLANDGVALGVFALFLGVAMSITAFPVLARILIERDLLRSRVGAMTLTCAAANDVSAWGLLLVVVTMTRAEHAAPAVVIVGEFLAFVTVMVVVVRPLLHRLEAFYESRGGVSQNLLAVVMLLLLASAVSAHAIGLHMIFGAFLLGALMPKRSGFVRELADKTEDFAIVFFLPVYFAYTGLRTEVGLLDRPGLWAVCGLLIAVAVVGKFAGSAVAARIAGLSWREAGALGALMNTRGLMELVILNVGLDLGVISPPVFAMLVLMAIVTTVMTTPLLDAIYPIVRLRAEALAAEPAVAAEPGAVLVPVAFAASGPRLLDLAVALAESDAPRVYALHVARPVERGALGARVSADAAPDHAALSPLLAHARDRRVDVRPLVLTSRSPAEDICDVARLKGAELIVMGWHKPVFAQSLLGGTLDRVLRDSHAAVAVLIDKGLPDAVRRLLLPYSGTVHDQLALRLAARLARRVDADLTLLHVVRPGREQPRLELEARRLLDTMAPDPMTGHQTRVLVVESDHPVDSVLAEAANHDLTILGVGEQWQLAPQLFGLRSERIAVENPSSLLIIRAGSPAPPLERERVRDEDRDRAPAATRRLAYT